MNKAILIGNLGADAELKTFTNGNSVLNFRLATTESWKTAEGEKKEKTNWHQCQVNGKRAQALAQYLTKGTKIAVTGSIQYREYEKDGFKRYATDIRVDDVEFTGGGKRDSQPDQDPNNGAEIDPMAAAAAGDSEIPF